MVEVYKKVFQFTIIIVLYYVSVKAIDYLSHKTSFDHNKLLAFTGVLFSLIVVFYIDDDTKEGWDLTPGEVCKGDPYMFQGDSEEAKMCRALRETPEGRCQLASNNCPNGYIGTPKMPFVYTPLSNDKWQNERCIHSSGCNCENKDEVCSFTKYA